MVKPAAGHRPLAYSSPEAVQTTGTVAILAGGRGYIGNIVGNLATLRPIPALASGDTAARSCAISSSGSDIPNMEIKSTYHWPVLGITDHKNAFFKVVRAVNGTTYLVP